MEPYITPEIRAESVGVGRGRSALGGFYGYGWMDRLPVLSFDNETGDEPAMT